MNRIILYVGMVYNFFCAGITANLIASNHKIGTLKNKSSQFACEANVFKII